jgi:hypothetical protein
MKDTSPAIERRFRRMLMQRTGAERLKMGCSMHATAQALAKAYISRQHPDAPLGKLQRLLFLRFYGADFTPQQRKKILSALSNLRRPGIAPAVVKPMTRKRLDRTALAAAKSTEAAAVRESAAPYGKWKNNQATRPRPSSRR